MGHPPLLTVEIIEKPLRYTKRLLRTVELLFSNSNSQATFVPLDAYAVDKSAHNSQIFTSTYHERLKSLAQNNPFVILHVYTFHHFIIFYPERLISVHGVLTLTHILPNEAFIFLSCKFCFDELTRKALKTNNTMCVCVRVLLPKRRRRRIIDFI